jgi:hypothetical protein
MPKKSKEVSRRRANGRFVAPRRYPIKRIAANGNTEPSHEYGELRAEDFTADDRLEAVVEI